VQDALFGSERKSPIYFFQSNDVSLRVEGGEKTNSDSLAPVTCDASKTTCWVEADSKVSSSFNLPRMPNLVESHRESIEDFLSKPYLLSSNTGLSYSTSSTYNTNIWTTNIEGLLTGVNSTSMVTAWNNKILGYNLIRGTFVVRVEVNAYPFQAGALLLHYIPNYTDILNTTQPNIALNYNNQLVSKFQHPFVILDIRDTVAEIKIPYIAPSPYYSVLEGNYGWGNVFLDSIVPLRTGGSGLTFADVAVYGYWEDVELAAPSIFQSNNRSVRKGDRETKEGVPGPISKALTHASKVAGALSDVPVLSSIMTSVEWAARMASGVASVFGWSKTRILNQQMPMFPSNYRYEGVCDGPSTGIPLSVIHDNKLAETPAYSITSEDEMSFNFLMNIPHYMPYSGGTNLVWTTGNSVGTNILTRNLAPQIFYTSFQTGTYNTHYFTCNQGGPMWYLSNFFAAWRGDFKLTLKFLKTQYHSGRLQITWTPTTTPTYTMDLNKSLYSLRQIVDIREQDEVELVLPYMVYPPYMKTTGTTDAYSGTLDIIVLNDLRCPETCSTTIDILEFYTAGDNFEFLYPQKSPCGPATFDIQSNDTSVLVDTTIGDVKALPATLSMDVLCAGERYTSIKQFLNKKTQIFSTTAASIISSTVDSFVLYPYACITSTINTATGAGLTAGITGDAFNYFAPMYIYMRGGVSLETSGGYNAMVYSNVEVQTIGTVNTAQPILLGNTGTAIGQCTQITNLYGTSPNSPTISPAITDYQNFGGVYNIPYYSRFPVSWIPYFNGINKPLYTGATARAIPETIFRQSCPLSHLPSNLILSRSCMDDFRFSFFIGCPPVAVSYT